MSETTAADPAVERDAREMGWRPQAEFRGDPEKWVDASEFVRRGETVMPILKAQNAKLRGELAGVKDAMTELQATVAAATEALETFREHHDKTAETAYKAAMRDLRTQREEARKEGETEKVVALDEAIDELTETAKPAKAPPPPKSPAPPAEQLHPDLPGWEADNAVWLADKQKKAYAQSIATYVRLQNPTIAGRAFLDKITEEVEAHFGGAPASKVDGGGTPAPARARGGKTFADLPAEAKAACERMGARLVGKGRAFEKMGDWQAQYAKDYDWS